MDDIYSQIYYTISNNRPYELTLKVVAHCTTRSIYRFDGPLVTLFSFIWLHAESCTKMVHFLKHFVVFFQSCQR